MLWHTSRRFYLRHPVQCLLALAGVTAGVAVVTGVLLLRGVLADSLDTAGAALTGDDGLRVLAPGASIDETEYARLARLPGAPDLVPLIRVPVQADGRPLHILGIDAVSAAPGLGGLLEREEAVILPAATAAQLGLAAGGRLAVSRRGRTLELEIAGVMPLPREFDGHGLMDIAAAQVYFGRGGAIDELWVPAASAAWLERHLPADWIVQTAASRRDAAGRLTRGLRTNLLAVSLLALAVGLFVAYSVLSFLFVQRRRSFGVLRALGVRPWQLAGLIAREALLLGALGGLLGIWLGTWLAGVLLALVRDPVIEIYRGLPALTVEGGFGLYAAIVLAGMLATLAATLPVIREAARLPPLHWLRSLRDHPSRSIGRVRVGGVIVLALAGVACIVFTDTLVPAQVGLFLLLAAFAVAAPVAGLWLLARLARLLRVRDLALLQAGAARVRPALSALALAVAVTMGIGIMVADFRAGVDGWISQLLRADAYLTVQQGVIDDEVVRRIEALPDVVALSSARRTRLADGRELVAYDLPEAAWDGFEWIARADDLRAEFRAGRAVLVTEPFARRHGVRVGQPVSLPAADETLRLPVAGIFRDYSTEQGFIALDARLYRAYWGDRVRDNLGLYFAVGAGGAEVEAVLADRGPRLTSAATVRQQTLAVFDRTFRITAAMQWLVGLVAAVALVSCLLALALERARDYATLRALGMTRRRLGVLVVTQTFGLAALAVILALPAAWLLHWVLAGVIQPRAFGWTVAPGWPLGAMLPVVLSALIAGVLAGLYPAWRIARQAPGRVL